MSQTQLAFNLKAGSLQPELSVAMLRGLHILRKHTPPAFQHRACMIAAWGITYQGQVIPELSKAATFALSQTVKMEHTRGPAAT